MSQVDIGRVALGAPALQQVFVVSRPECLLVKAWARNERSNTEDAAALIGNLFRDCDDALEAVGGTTDARTLMVESNDRVLVVARVAENMSAAFVFEQSAPLGLIRVQARQLTAQLARTLAADPTLSGDLARSSPPSGHTLPPRPTPRTEPSTDDRSPAFGVNPAPAAPPASEPSARPTGLAARIASFAQHANDARSALLRLSLRTGLPMELLERAATLSPPQAEIVQRALDELEQKKPRPDA